MSIAAMLQLYCVLCCIYTVATLYAAGIGACIQCSYTVLRGAAGRRTAEPPYMERKGVPPGIA